MLGSLLGWLPALLHTYWLLAAGAAVAALLPLTPTQFRQAEPAAVLKSLVLESKLMLGLCRQAVQLSASRGKTWTLRPQHALGAATVSKRDKVAWR